MSAPPALPAPATATAPARRWPKVVVTLVVGAAATAYFSWTTSYGEVASELGAVERSAVALVVGLALFNLATYWLVLMAAVPGLGLWQAALVQLPSTAMSNVLPAGGAFGTAYTVARLRSRGLAVPFITGMLFVNGFFGFLGKLGIGVVALVLLTPAGGSSPSAAGTAAVLIVAFGLTGAWLLRSTRLPRLASRVVDPVIVRVSAVLGRPQQPGLAANAVGHIQSGGRELLADRTRPLVAAHLLSHVTLLVLFLACARAIGVTGAPTAELIGAFAVSRMVALVSFTPGGVGVVEVSLAATLVALGGEPAEAAATVVVYRAATYLLPTVCGLGLLGVGLRLQSAADRSIPSPGPGAVDATSGAPPAGTVVD